MYTLKYNAKHYKTKPAIWVYLLKEPVFKISLMCIFLAIHMFLNWHIILSSRIKSSQGRKQV